jgi:hypothetical protein
MEKDYLILKRPSTSRPSGRWNYDVLANGQVWPHLQGERGARRKPVDADLNLRLSPRSRAELWLRDNAPGGHGCICQELWLHLPRAGARRPSKSFGSIARTFL